MPAKSEKQKRLIYAKRNTYKSKSKTPKKWKWIWNNEWLHVENLNYIKFFEDFNQNISSNNLSELFTDLLSKLEKELNLNIEIITSNENTLEFNVDYLPIEPEEGSYTQRTEVVIKLYKNNDTYIVNINGISGQYGTDDLYDDESEIDPEFDYDVHHSKINIYQDDIKKENIYDFIYDELKDYF